MGGSVALDVYLHTSVLGLGKLVPHMDLVRFIEYGLVYPELALSTATRLLDIGCGYSIFPLYLASKHRCHVHVVDNEQYLPGVIQFQRKKLRRLSPSIQDKVVIQHQDARHLAYTDGTFDRVTCISVIAHIPGRGDSEAMAEIGRVLAPGGRAIVTVPFADRYEERDSAPWVEYFDRSYDAAALEQRLIRSSGLRERSRVYFGTANEITRLYYRSVPRPLRMVMQVLTPLVAPRVARSGPGPFDGSWGVLLTLEKTSFESRAHGQPLWGSEDESGKE